MRGVGYTAGRTADTTTARIAGFAADRVAVPTADGAASRSADVGADCVAGCAADRGADRAVNRAADRAVNRGADRGADHGADRGADRGVDRAANRAADGGADQVLEAPAINFDIKQCALQEDELGLVSTTKTPFFEWFVKERPQHVGVGGAFGFGRLIYAYAPWRRHSSASHEDTIVPREKK